jgi:NADH-quinone oxidoreductase subunit N
MTADPLTADTLLGLLPLIVIAGAAVIVMLVIAVRRDYRLTVILTFSGLLLALATLPFVAERAPWTATSLLRIDRYALFFIGLVLAAGIAVTLLCYEYFLRREEQKEELYVLLLTTLLGAAVLAASSHFASFFLGLETLSVSLFAMIAYPVRDQLPLEAGIKYMVLSGAASAFLLFGMALVYADLGVLSFAELGRLSATSDFRLSVLIGVVMIVVGLGFKLSLVPFHLWTPDVYQGAPAPVTALLATVSKSAILALFLRYFVVSGSYGYEALSAVLSVIAVASILVGNFLALLQNNVKRLLAYSSIAHLGYVLVALIGGRSLGSAFAVESVSFYLVAYVISTLAAFGIVAVLSSSTEEAENLPAYQGLFWRHAWLATIFTAALLSLAGIPLTVGFIGKFYVFSSGINADLWLLVWTVVIGSGLGLYYYLRLVLVMIRPADDATAMASVPTIGCLTLTALTAFLLWLGVYPGAFMEMLQSISKSLS